MTALRRAVRPGDEDRHQLGRRDIRIEREVEARLAIGGGAGSPPLMERAKTVAPVIENAGTIRASMPAGQARP